ncbi:hypothetical protein [Nocardia sp. NPDC003963]
MVPEHEYVNPFEDRGGAESAHFPPIDPEHRRETERMQRDGYSSVTYLRPV